MHSLAPVLVFSLSFIAISLGGKASKAPGSKDDLKGEELAAVTLSNAEKNEKLIKIDKSDKKLAKFDENKDGYINGAELQEMAKKEVVNEPVHEPKKATPEEKSLRDKILEGIKISTKNGTRPFLHKYDLNKDGYTDLKEGFTAAGSYIKKQAIKGITHLATMAKNFFKKHGFLGDKD